MALHPLFENILGAMIPFVPNPEHTRPDYTARIPAEIDFPGLDNNRLVAVFGTDEDDDAVAAPITREQENEWFHEGVEFAAGWQMPAWFCEELAQKARNAQEGAAVPRKPNTFESLPLAEQLVASIAVANYRKESA